jgi:hypothetical protein
VNNSITVTDGTNSWSQSVGNPGVGATATANTIVGFVIGATITNGGSGYTSAPAVTITGAGTGATASATLTDGVVTGITINSAGSGYTGGATITIAPPVIPFRVDYNGGTITTTYSSAPTEGRTISATYRYTTSAITAAISASSEQWLQLTVDGVNQVPRQRVLAVPFAQRAAVADTAVTASSALTANMATSVADGSITAQKFSPNALTDAIGPVGNVIYSRSNRTDLIDQGYINISTIDKSSLIYLSSNSVNSFKPSSHTTVWTGSEMIVWGGGGLVTDTGARYNPDSDSWIATATGGAATARGDHSAVWTGSEMIIWGGQSTTGNLNTGGRYKPSTNSWVSITTTGAPTARFYHSAVWTGSEMIIWGGQSTTGNLNTGARYNPTTNSWTATSSAGAPTARVRHRAIWTGTEMIVWGGIDASGQATQTGARYNPTTNTWISMNTAEAPSARYAHIAVWTGSEMIIWGGSQIYPSNSGGRYNPVSNTWTPLNSLGTSDTYHEAKGVWAEGKLVITRNDDTHVIYDNVIDKWYSLSPSGSLYIKLTNVTSDPIWLNGKLLSYSSISGKVVMITPDYINVYANR